MALETEFENLTKELFRLGDVLRDLEVAVGDRPPASNDVKLVENFNDATDELQGWQREAIAASIEGQNALGHPMDVDRARRALAACQKQTNQIARSFWWQLGSYERIDELMRLGRERGGEWPAWGGSVKEAIDRCQSAMAEVSRAISYCWQEIAERVGMTTVSVQATGIDLGLDESHGLKHR